MLSAGIDSHITATAISCINFSFSNQRVSYLKNQKDISSIYVILIIKDELH